MDDDFKESVILSEIDINAFEKVLKQIRMCSFTIGLEQISKEKLEIMVQKRNFDFTVMDYKEMDEYAPELCAQYILLNQQEFEEVFDQIMLTTEVFETLVMSKEFSSVIKNRIVARDGVELMTGKIAYYLCSSDVQINKEIFDVAWEMLDNSRKQKELLFRYLNILESDDFERYLPMLEEPYSSLERKAYRHEELIPDNEENRALVNRLLFVQYLTSKDYETQPQPNSKQVRKVIRCRVKAKQMLSVK